MMTFLTHFNLAERKEEEESFLKSILNPVL